MFVTPLSRQFAAALVLGTLLNLTSQAAHAAEKVTLCYGALASTLVPLAKQQNFYAADGIEAEMRPFPSGKLALEAMLSGQCQMAAAAETPVIHHTLRGAAMRIVAVIATSNNFERLIVRTDHGKHSQSRNGFFEQPQARAMGASQDLLGRRKNGSEFPIEVGLNSMETDEGALVISAILDITERKQAQATLDEQMAELRRWSDATTGREGRILDLKHEVNELLMHAGHAPRYPSAES